VPCFDARFYEARALWFYARARRRRIAVNVRLPRLDVPYSRRPEVDGILDEGRGQRAIEVKSFPVGERELGAICAHYTELGFRRLTVIAPAFESSAPSGAIDVELVPFTPDLAALREHYRRAWPAPSRRIASWLAGGGIHFRFSAAEVSPASPGLRRTLNQVDKGLRSVEQLTVELSRRVTPRVTPIRVHWSPVRVLFPKDLYFRERAAHVLAAPLVFDIDGPLIHGAMFPCTIDPESGLCADCTSLAKQHALRLARTLQDRGLEPAVFFSGHRGFHLYVFEGAPLSAAGRAALHRDILGQRIAFDRQVTRAAIPLIAFPGSLHGTTTRALVEVEIEGARLAQFHPEQSPAVGAP
jgi:hypothetical protein